MKNIILRSLITGIIIFASVSSFAKDAPTSINVDGERIILEIKKKYSVYQSRGYQLAPGAIPMIMASWLPIENQVDQKSLMLSYQHDAKFFDSIGNYVNRHICRTKLGEQLCRIYFKKVNQKSLASAHLAEALARHLVLAISDQQKILDSWSSNYVMWLFIDPNEITVASLNRWIVHEMFQIIDIKNTVGGIVVAGKDFTDSQLCAILSGSVNRGIRFASSAIRSYKVEDAIMTDLYNKNHQTLAHLKIRSCQFNIEWANTQLMEFNANIKNSAYMQMINHIPEQCFSSVARSAMNADDSIEYGKKLFSENPGTCEFLSEPDLNQIETLDVDLDFLDTWFHGPRPRVGGV